VRQKFFGNKNRAWLSSSSKKLANVLRLGALRNGDFFWNVLGSCQHGWADTHGGGGRSTAFLAGLVCLSLPSCLLTFFALGCVVVAETKDLNEIRLCWLSERRQRKKTLTSPQRLFVYCLTVTFMNRICY